MRLPQQYTQPLFNEAGDRLLDPDGQPLGALPEGHPLIDEEVHCEECGATLKEAGTRESNGTWFETGWFTPTHDNEPPEQQNYCSGHYGCHVGVWGALAVHYLLDD